MEERCAIASEILDLAVALGSREFEMRGHALRITNFFDLGDIKAADLAIEAHTRLAIETADPFERWIGLMWNSARELLTGHFENAERLSLQAFDLSRFVPGPHAFDENGPLGRVVQQILIQEIRYQGLPEPGVIDHYRARYPDVPAWHVAFLYRLTRLGCVDEVRRELDAVSEQSLVTFDRAGTWLTAMSYLSEAIALVGDQERAAVLYPLLLPYAERNATLSLIAYRGSIARPLGLLAATLGRVEDAARHFDAALAINRRMGMRPLIAVTLLDYARFLARQGESRVDRAYELAEEARAIASELGWTGLVHECDVWLDQHRGAVCEQSAPSPSDDLFHLARNGQVWTLSHGAERVLLNDTKGLTYLAELVRQPDRDIHVLDLVALFAEPPGSESGAAADRSADFGAGERPGFGDDLLDAKARRAYDSRLTKLSAELHSAEAAGEPERTLVLRQEIHSLHRELARATGLGGRPRRSSNTERARVSVTRTIRLALTRIVEVSPELGGELARGVRTGTFCCYTRRPDALLGLVVR